MRIPVKILTEFCSFRRMALNITILKKPEIFISGHILINMRTIQLTYYRKFTIGIPGGQNETTNLT